MKKKEKGLLIVLSGPSGAGKSTVVKKLMQQRGNIHFSVSYTTRAPRNEDVDGVTYNFVDRTEFERMIQVNEFLEYAEYSGNYYGTSLKVIEEKQAAGIDVLLDIEVVDILDVQAVLDIPLCAQHLLPYNLHRCNTIFQHLIPIQYT